jgi:glycogen debranching enzyme
MAQSSHTVAEERHYYILAPAEAPAEPPLVLKHGDVFGVFDRFGDIDADSRRDAGIYYKGSRFLSRFRLCFAGSRPLLLSSTVRRDNVVLAVDLTNPDLHSESGLWMPRGSLHIYRAMFLWENTLCQQLHVRNFSRSSVAIRLTMEFDADFVDIFEIRGAGRERRGDRFPASATPDGVVLEYRGLDEVERRAVIRCPSHPQALTPEGCNVTAVLKPAGDCTVVTTVCFESGDACVPPADHDANLAKATAAYLRGERECVIATSNEQFNLWLDRSRNDLRMLTTRNSDGAYPYAGVPWFATPFGRDGIITALQCLWMDPALARGVLAFLTRTQARVESPEQDAEPGKILHEARDGEMAALGEIPFGRYYGSVDATPLYLVLAAAYFKRTGDVAFLNTIWDGIRRALEWVDGPADRDGDGFVEYRRMGCHGLVQQGWKDSDDSVFHADGSLAEAPIALCEVQAYVYAAKTGLAEVAQRLGHAGDARRLWDEAAALRDRFEQAFWAPSIGTYAIALDGQKRQCLVRSSNAGHALYCGITGMDRARSIADDFLTEHYYSGWGIRTIAEGEARYNPMSYHNGSVWPHDNALIAAGCSRYGFTGHACKILSGLYETAAHLELSRLPELLCGFRRRAGKGPVLYPTACSPQAWSAGASFLMLQSSVGLFVDALARQVVLRHPVLPEFVEHVNIFNLAVGDAMLDLRLFRSGGSVAVTVERRTGDVDVLVVR